MNPLSRKQKAVLNYIADFHSSRGVAPMLREIAAAFCLSPSSAAQYVGILRKKGHLTVEPFAHRGIRLTSGRRAWKVSRERRGEFEKRIGSRLTGETDLGRIFALVRGEVRAWIDVDQADLLVEEPDRRVLRTGEFFGVEAPPPPAGPTGSPVPPPEAVASAAPGAVDRLSEAAFRRRRTVSGPEGVALPVPGRDGPVGVLRLHDRRSAGPPALSEPAGRVEGFDEVRMSRAEAVADALGPALDRARLDADLRRRIRMQSALIALCRTINAMDDLPRVLRDTWAIVRRLVGTECGVIAVRDERGLWWTLLMTDVIDGRTWEDTRIQPMRIPKNEAVEAIFTAPWYIRLRTPEEVARMEAEARDTARDGFARLGDKQRRSRSFLYVPLKAGGDVIGYLSAQSYAFNAYSLRHAEDLAMISEYIGLAVQTAWRRNRERAAAARIKGDLLDPARADLGDRTLKGVVVLESELRRRIDAEGDRVRDVLQPVVDRLSTLSREPDVIPPSRHRKAPP